MSEPPPPPAAGDEDEMDRLVEALAVEFPHVPRSRVVAAVTKAYARFASSPIPEFVPLFIERKVRSELARVGTGRHPDPGAAG